VSTYVHRVTAAWGDCDPAGIVYFPRFFDFFHQAMEQWFGALGHPYEDVIMRRRIGFPAVHTEADFSRPTQYGDALEVRLSLGRIGERSITLEYAVHGEHEPEPRLVGKTVCAVMNIDPESDGFRRAMPLPDDLRSAMGRFAAP
jgi:4-hydroxybenzoyl-CoA thioesterase